jgi:hypothetical protein
MNAPVMAMRALRTMRAPRPSPAIQAYAARASVLPGQQLVLHVSTARPRFRVHFHRWGETLEPVLRSGWLHGEPAPARGPDQDWDWPAYAFDIPEQWPSAVYIACFETDGAAGPPPSVWMPHGAALFVVRGAGRGSLLYKLPLATYQAYNHSGGGCLYHNPPRSEDPPGARLSLRRPGGATGGEVWCAPDHYDTSTPRQTFAHWDAPFIRWLLRQGYQPEFCTDFDIHADAALCRRYRLMLGAGHDEYWSEPTRDHVEDYIASGGNVAFFGANLCWWRIHLADDGAAMVCHQGGPRGALDHWWPRSGVGRPEDGLGGVSYRHGGGWWDGPRRTQGYRVHEPDHWAFEGTGLRRGDVFGQATTPPLVGYECDGAPLEDAGEAAEADDVSPASHASDAPIAGGALPRLSSSAADCGTPDSFRVLASSILDAGWQERPPREGHAAGEGLHAACMGVYRRGGTVFTAGTTDWAQVLGSGQEPRVDIITDNVIRRLLADRRAS